MRITKTYPPYHCVSLKRFLPVRNPKTYPPYPCVSLKKGFCRSGKVEKWKSAICKWKSGKVEKWKSANGKRKSGKVEKWKNLLFHFSAFPFFRFRLCIFMLIVRAQVRFLSTNVLPSMCLYVCVLRPTRIKSTDEKHWITNSRINKYNTKKRNQMCSPSPPADDNVRRRRVLFSCYNLCCPAARPAATHNPQRHHTYNRPDMIWDKCGIVFTRLFKVVIELGKL